MGKNKAKENEDEILFKEGEGRWVRRHNRKAYLLFLQNQGNNIKYLLKIHNSAK